MKYKDPFSFKNTKEKNILSSCFSNTSHAQLIISMEVIARHKITPSAHCDMTLNPSIKVCHSRVNRPQKATSYCIEHVADSLPICPNSEKHRGCAARGCEGPQMGSPTSGRAIPSGLANPSAEGTRVWKASSPEKAIHHPKFLWAAAFEGGPLPTRNFSSRTLRRAHAGPGSLSKLESLAHPKNRTPLDPSPSP